ncbi:MAG: Xaa-Pro aminopeptidase, partial [Gammaproteobacteria bacterium HGW-Gammaproteobacteria-5]
TIEPGIYIAPGSKVPARWQGIGIRIEDDVAITADGHEVLTAAIPSAPDEIEHILALRG